MNNRNTKGELTQAQVGELLGITRARVYQIEKRALLKLRHAFDEMEIKTDFHDLDNTSECKATRQLVQEFSARITR